MIYAANVVEIEKENFLNELLDLASCILDDRKVVQSLYRNDHKDFNSHDRLLHKY